MAISLAMPGVHILVLTDGCDTGSTATIRDLSIKFAKLRNVHVTICGISLSCKDAKHLKEISQSGAHCCELRVVPSSAEDIVALFHSILAR